MKNKKITERQFYKKFVNHYFHLLKIVEKDKFIVGDAFVHFTERGIQIVPPENVILKHSPKDKV